MPKIYDFLEADDVDLIDEVMRTYHQRLIDLNTTVRAITVTKRNKDGEDEPCLTGYGKAPALACISVIKDKAKLFLKHDAEITIDLCCWRDLNRKQKIAVIDHELTHLEPKRDKDGHPIIDEDGRPKLTTKPDDFIVWGFHSIIAKHKENSVEGPAVRMLATSCEGDWLRDAATYSDSLTNRRAALNEAEEPANA